MGSNAFQKHTPYGDNSHYHWFIVQYEQTTRKCTRKVVNTNEIMWKEDFQMIKCNDGELREHVLLIDRGKLHLAYILYKSKTQKDCIERHHYLQWFLIQTLNGVKENTTKKTEDAEQLFSDDKYWVLVMYNPCTEKKDQAVIAVLEKKYVTFKLDSSTHATMAFIKEENFTYKGLALKCNINLGDLLYMMDFVKKESLSLLLKYITIDRKTSSQQLNDEMDAQFQKISIEKTNLRLAKKKITKQKTIMLCRISYATKLLGKKRFKERES